MVVAAFVAPFLLPATARFVATAAALPNVSIGVVTAEPVERLSPDLKQLLAGHWRVDDPLDPQQIVEAVRGLSQQMGHVERLVGALEQLQVPMAYAREMLGLDGMDVETALNVRDKSRMKSVLGPLVCPVPGTNWSRTLMRRWRLPKPSDFRWSPNRPPARERRRRTGWTICQRCAAGSRRFLRTPGHLGCSRSSWSGTSTPSTA